MALWFRSGAIAHGSGTGAGHGTRRQLRPGPENCRQLAVDLEALAAKDNGNHVWVTPWTVSALDELGSNAITGRSRTPFPRWHKTWSARSAHGLSDVGVRDRLIWPYSDISPFS